MITPRGVRKIVKGTVKFFGRTYRPSDPHSPYTGELDGQKWYFIGYYGKPELLAMWGTEALYKASRESDAAFDKQCKILEPNIDPITGCIKWYFWHSEFPDQNEGERTLNEMISDEARSENMHTKEEQ